MSELERIREGAGKARLPDFVVDVAYELGVDSTGDPAVWIWTIFSDDEAAAEKFGEDTDLVREKIFVAFHDAGIERWPYVRFRSASEHAELAGKR